MTEIKLEPVEKGAFVNGALLAKRNTERTFCPAKAPFETAMHFSAGNIRGLFAAADEALLTQGEDNKGKRTEYCRCKAACGLFFVASITRCKVCRLAVLIEIVALAVDDDDERHILYIEPAQSL